MTISFQGLTACSIVEGYDVSEEPVASFFQAG
jgi:hypothetical protein